MAGGADPPDGPALRGYDDVPSMVVPSTRALPPRSPPPRPATPLPPPGASSTASASSPSTPLPQLASPDQALRVGQGQRLANLGWGIFAISVVLLAALPILDIPSTSKAVLAISMALNLVAAVWMRQTLLRADVSNDAAALPWLLLTVANFGTVGAMGAFSAACIVFVAAIFYTSLRYAGITATLVYVATALFHAALVAGIAFHLYPDPGLLQNSLGTRDTLLTEALVQALFAGALLVSHVTRSATADAMAELQHATQAAAQRDALLLEAREALERALHPGGPGRFTDQVLGSFRLGVMLGHGAMGEVYEATRIADGTPAAVKLLRIDALAQPGLLARFLREAAAVAALDSPHVVRVLETGDATAPLPYIAMERLAGHDLAYHLRERPRLPPADVLELVRQLADGVDAAHRAGVVHRDLKPQNIFLHEQEGARVWKVLDFGVSKLQGYGETQSGHIVGTPAYMAPEQVRGGEVDGRADVYGLAVVAFRCLTGELPYRGRDTAELLYKIAHAPVPAPSRRAPDLPRALDAVLQRAMAKHAADRPATAAQLARELAAALA